MRQTLENLFYGINIPSYADYRYRPDYKQYFDAAFELENRLKKLFSPEQEKLFNDYVEASADLSATAVCESFKDGFSLAIHLILDSLETLPQPPKM